jgi:hypothetical protein
VEIACAVFDPIDASDAGTLAAVFRANRFALWLMFGENTDTAILLCRLESDS